MNARTSNRPVTHCPGPVTRREVLRWGSLGVGGLSLAERLQAHAQANDSGSASIPDTSVIFIWLPGGPPHTETYDMKPDAPADYRGEFNPISTVVPELQVCELMPRHARIAHKYNIIRSIAHEFADHGGGHKRFLTGRLPKSPVGFVNDAPAAPSIVARMRRHVDIGLPNYIAGIPRGDVDTFSFGAAYLGPSYAPFTIHGDPSDPKFQVRNLSLDSRVEGRLDERKRLLREFDRLRRSVDNSGLMDAMDEFNQRAVSLLTSDRARRAFDLSEEPESLRARYGHHCWGYRALMARRLVEAGCSFVTMVLENAYQSGIKYLPDKQSVYNWDSHAVNCHMFKDLRIRLPLYDQVITALVEDLYDRGLDKKVLLIVTGEFGRTPRINPVNGRPGRDHWPQAMSMLVAGGGMQTGQVIGSTTSKGERPKDRALTPNDLWATVYRHLGIDPTTPFLDHSGRPQPILPFGEPIAELL